MAGVTRQLLSAAAVLAALRLIGGYGFNNCIEDPLAKGQSFKCIHRNEKILSAIISDLPPSTVNLTITASPVQNLLGGSFADLPNLQDLKMDHNHLTTIDQFAFQHLHQLKSLNLSFNYISELHPAQFEDLHNLTFLSLTKNNLKELPGGIFSTLLKLHTLLIRQNSLSNFSGIVESVSHLKRLTKLDLCFNKLTSLSHSNASLPKSLTALYICRNDLSTLGCHSSFLESIHVLDFSYNPDLPTAAFQGVDLRRVRYLRLRSTSVRILEFLNITNVNAGHVDFSGTGLSNDTLLTELCRFLDGVLKGVRDFYLTGNGIEALTNETLYYCPEISGIVDLSKNKLKRMTCLNFLQRHTQVQEVRVEHNGLILIPPCREDSAFKFSRLSSLSYRYNHIRSVSFNAFRHMPNLKTLKLNINTIAFLHKKALKGLTRLEMLRLDNNLLTDLYDSIFEDLVSLQTLNLRNNRISVIFNGTFLSLGNLTTLDLGGNKISQILPSGLEGLKRLSKFYLDGNNLKVIESSLYRAFQYTLRVLDLKGNQIRFLDPDKSYAPFINLKNLRELKLDGQLPHGLTILPRTLFRGLYSLKDLYLTNNKISYLHPDTFDDLKRLEFLTLESCCIGVTQLQPGVFKNLRNLTKLVVENMGLQNFSKEVFGNLSQLHSIQLNHNAMTSIEVDALESLPQLHYIDLRNTPLSCTCTNSFLKNWTLHNLKVQVVYLYHLQCPHDPSLKFYKFDTNVCYIDLGKYLFFSTALAIVLFTISPLLHVKLYWKMKYGYYVFSSWFGERWRRLRDKEEKCQYDAFVSYNNSDEQWVMHHLLPMLEGSGSSFKLCLHHRDFEPGRYIIDNIVSAVYSSRKTICVVSRNFLRSEWCSLEIQLASYRLFDEHRDVLVPVFLEPISERQLSSYHRMRKVMLKRTYLQWPGSDCNDPLQAQNLFWSKLRRALRSGSRLESEENDTDEDHVTESQETEHLETSRSDENSYLLP